MVERSDEPDKWRDIAADVASKIAQWPTVDTSSEGVVAEAIAGRARPIRRQPPN